MQLLDLKAALLPPPRKHRHRYHGALPTLRCNSADEKGDPVLAGFLRFLEKQMTEHPEDIVEADADQLRRIGRLVKGVKTA